MNETTVVFMCRKSPIANSDAKAYNDGCFELALPSLQFTPQHLKDKPEYINFKSLQLAQAHVRGRGLLAIYQVTIPSLHIETINTMTGFVTINPAYQLKPSNIECLYHPVMLGKDKFVKYSRFNMDEIKSRLAQDIANGLATQRAGFPRMIGSSDPNAVPDTSRSSNESKGCSFI